MEFKTCPSCKASVLDDDAENCPFCGASMSGQPTAAPPKPAAAPPAAPASGKPAVAPAKAADADRTAKKKKPASGAKRRGASAPAIDADADPFEIDTRAVQKAIPVSRKPVKGRMHRVVCPMCETPGFIAPAHAGKEVKCCNPECLVPIFTAPLPERPKDEEPEPGRGMSSLVFTVVAVLLAGGIGFGVWHFVLRESGTRNGTTDVSPGPGPDVTPQDNGPEIVVETDTTPPAPPPVPLAEVRAESLDNMVRNARQRQNNRSKPYGRRLSSEAFAEVGDLDEAVAQIEAMRRVEGYEPFYEVEPWVVIALARLDAGDADGANGALDSALEKAEFPVSGRPALDAAGALAGALALTGRLDEARRIAAENSAPEMRGRLSTLWRGAIDSRSFEIDQSAARPDLSSMPNPQWATVTRFLMFRGDVDAALEWAESAESISVQDNARGVWAAELVLSAAEPAGPAILARIEELAGRLEPAGRARVWAAVAQAQRQREETEASKAALQRGVQAAAELEIPTAPRPVPTLAQIYESDAQPRAGLPDQSEYVSGALACIDLAQLEAAAGQSEQAWSHVESALRLLRGATPSPSATQELVDECMDDVRVDAIKRRLVQTLELENAFLAFNQYRKQCGILHEQATLRFAVQVELLRRAVSWGLGPQVWEEIQIHSDADTPNELEPYLTTTLPGMIALQARQSGDTTLAESVAAAVSNAAAQPTARDRLELDLAAALDADDLDAAAAALRAYREQDPYPLYLVSLRSVTRLIGAGRHLEAFQLAMNIPYPLAREDSYWLIGAAAVRDGRHSAIWRLEERDRLSATEQVSLERGFIDGLPLAPPEPEEESTEVAAD